MKHLPSSGTPQPISRGAEVERHPQLLPARAPARSKSSSSGAEVERHPQLLLPGARIADAGGPVLARWRSRFGGTASSGSSVPKVLQTRFCLSRAGLSPHCRKSRRSPLHDRGRTVKSRSCGFLPFALRKIRGSSFPFLGTVTTTHTNMAYKYAHSRYIVLYGSNLCTD